LLIDRTHKKWFWVTLALAAGSVGVYVWLYRRTPGGLTGGDVVGMLYGIAGSALMLFAGALSFLRRVPSWWWLGMRKTWLRGHIWLGLLSGVLILCHSGGRFGGPLEQILMFVVLLTLATGVFGLVLQQFLPRLLTLRVEMEAPYDQVPRLCEAMRQDADDLIARVKTDAKLDREVSARLEEFYADEVRPFLALRFARSSPLAHPLRAETVFDRVRSLPGMAAVGPQLERLRICCDERRQMAEQEKLYHLLHGWLLVHVPLSVLLLVLGAAHVVLSLYY
jgi:hypothetical protein